MVTTQNINILIMWQSSKRWKN